MRVATQTLGSGYGEHLGTFEPRVLKHGTDHGPGVILERLPALLKMLRYNIAILVDLFRPSWKVIIFEYLEHGAVLGGFYSPRNHAKPRV